MNNVASLSHASKYKGNKGKMEQSIRIHFNTVQNSSGRYEGWHHVESFIIIILEMTHVFWTSILIGFNAKCNSCNKVYNPLILSLRAKEFDHIVLHFIKGSL
jgi:hypothetical protein